MYVWNAGALSVWSYSQWDVQKPAKGWELTNKKSILLGWSQCCYEARLWHKESPKKVRTPSRPQQGKDTGWDRFSFKVLHWEASGCAVSLVETLEVTRAHGLCQYYNKHSSKWGIRILLIHPAHQCLDFNIACLNNACYVIADIYLQVFHIYIAFTGRLC